MNELDLILLDQWHSCKRRKKIYKRVKKLLRNDPLIDIGEGMLEKKMLFLESMISDKTLLLKKHKRKKEKDQDILARNPVYEWYRTALYATVFSYKMFTDSVSSYMSYFKKGKE